MKTVSILLCLSLFVSLESTAQNPPPLESRSALPAATQSSPSITAASIISQAHKAAGGVTWVKPYRLKLTGYNLVRRGDEEVVWNKYAMWREYAADKSAAHAANGKVRIEAWSDEKLALLITYDGKQTYDQNGVMENQSANAMWSSNFGYGAIRNALDKGWQQSRLADDMVDGKPSYMVKLTDPEGGITQFGIRQADHAVVYVGFETPRGWHERRYSNFYRKDGVNWLQPGRVRLFYNGVKTNEAIWTDFQLIEPESDKNTQWHESLFTVTEAPAKPNF